MEHQLDWSQTPQRVQKLFGKLPNKAGIPDRSSYNCKKWAPLLDAPFRISNKCCSVMKKDPLHRYEKLTGAKPITGQLANESRLRKQQWLKNGCNGFDMKTPISNPISFWTEQDVLQYIKDNNVEIPSVYGEIVDDNFIDGMLQTCIGGCERNLRTTKCQRTGCMYCLYAIHLEKGKNRLEMLKETHPKIYEYCMGGGEFDADGMWIPNQKGLGLKFVIDWLNEMFGGNFIKY